MIRFTCSHGDNHHKKQVAKARKLPRPATMKSLNRIAANMERAVTFSFTKGMGTFKRRIPKKLLAEAYRTGNLDAIMAVIPFESLEADLAAMSETNKTALLRASKSTVSKLPPGLAGLRFDTANPAIDQFLSKNVGKLVTEISRDTRAVIQQAIRSQFDVAVSPNKAAEAIRGSLGLTTKQAQAVATFENKLIEQGVSGRRLDNLVARRRSNAVKARSRVIARTELTRSVNQGQLQIFNQAAEEGLIDKAATRKQWVSTVDDVTSDVCLDLDSDIVGLDEQFHSSITGESFDGPPAHANCRSAVIMVLE